MGRSDASGMEAILSIPPSAVAGLLMAVGLIVGSVDEFLGRGRWGIDWALSTLGIAVLVLLVDLWQPHLSRWLAGVGSAAVVHMAGSRLGPGSLSLLAIPTALLAGLVGPGAAAALAGGETVLLLFLLFRRMPGLDSGSAGVALTLVWATVAATFLAYRRSRQVGAWSWQYYERARTLLEQARDQQVELKQIVADAADANRQLMVLNQKLAAARLAAEQAERAKATFVANVSHELRTPLNLIIGFSEMITHAPKTYGSALPPALLADLGVILRNAQHLCSLIDDVLDLSQVESGKLALARERVALREVIEGAEAAVRRLFASKGLYLQSEVAPDLPPVFCDRTRIREVLLNLLSNAVRFTEQGGVRLRAWCEGADVVVSVADTGLGIADADLGRVFQPFQQLDASIRRRAGGTGLGLSISKSFIELHGGRIWFESKSGQGTTFFFRLPIDPQAPLDGTPVRWLTPGWEYRQRTHPSKAPVPDARPRLVVMEAGQSLQHLLGRHMDGVEIVPAANLEEAIDRMAELPTEALLVNEVSVPAALQLLGAARGLPPGVPAIVCSLPGVSEAASSLGVADYLVKPFPPERLLATLDRLQIAGKSVLVVDDEPEALRLYWRILASAGRGYRVLTAASGQEALELLGEKPSVVLLDLVMPEMDGFRFLAVRNQDQALRRIPVVVVSARDPAGQPIVSDALAVTQGGGLSTGQLLACIEAIRRALAPAGQPGDRVPLQNRPG